LTEIYCQHSSHAFLLFWNAKVLINMSCRKPDFKMVD